VPARCPGAPTPSIGSASTKQDDPLHVQTQVARRLHVSQSDKVFPEDTSPSRVGLDDMFQGRRKLSVGFVLPRGTYAPLVIRALVESPH